MFVVKIVQFLYYSRNVWDEKMWSKNRVIGGIRVIGGRVIGGSTVLIIHLGDRLFVLSKTCYFLQFSLVVLQTSGVFFNTVE